VIEILVIASRFGTIDRGMETFFPEFISRFDKSRFHFTVLSCPHDRPPMGETTYVKRRALRHERAAWLYRIPILRAVLKSLKLQSETAMESLTLMLSSLPYLLKSRFDIIMPAGSWTYLFASHFSGKGARIVSLGHAGPVGYQLSRSDIFIAITPADEIEAKRLRPSIRTMVIPSVIDTKRFIPKEDRRPKDAHPKKILCVAALADWKRQDLLLDAVEQLEEDAIVILHGRGPHKSRLAEHPLAKKGRVVFDESSLPDMAACYREADIFSLPSPGETFGLVFLEALASGLNVVAHDAPRQRYVIGESGFFCDVFDKKSYARALRAALHEDRRARNIEHARRFDFSVTIPRYEALFEELAAKGREDAEAGARA